MIDASSRTNTVVKKNIVGMANGNVAVERLVVNTE